MTAAAIFDRPENSGVLGRIQARLKNWLTRHHDMAELKELDALELREIAQDAGVSADELLRATALGSHAADEMPFMMQALNIDPTNVETSDPQAYRAMQANCATCSNKKGCRADLNAGAAGEHYLSYCANAEKLNALRAEPDMLSA